MAEPPLHGEPLLHRKRQARHAQQPTAMSRGHVRIRYCPRCRWLLRAGWLAQELLTTFEQELTEVSLAPGPSGVFEVELDGELLFSRKAAGRFPEAKELKQLVRDRIAPERSLGHSDRPLASDDG